MELNSDVKDRVHGGLRTDDHPRWVVRSRDEHRFSGLLIMINL